MKKSLAKCIITSILLFVLLLVSATPVRAYDITTSVSPTGNAWEWGDNTAWFQTFNGSGGAYQELTSTGDAIFWGRGFTMASLDITWVLKSIVSSNNIEFKEGHYYKTQISFAIRGFRTGTGSGATVGVQIPVLNRIMIPTNAPYKLVSMQPYELQCYESVSVAYSANQISSETVGCYRGTVVYDVIVQATRTATGKMQLGNGIAWLFESYVGLNSGEGYGTLRPLTITEYKPDDISSINQEQQQAGEQAQQDGQTAANQGQQTTEQGTQSLLSAITGFVGVLTNATPTNCQITGDMGALDLGALDFCQDNPPVIIQTIGSLILIGVTIPIVIWTVKKIISMFRSFTNG